MINQCDGCRRKLPIRDGNHYDPKTGSLYIGCTAKRYVAGITRPRPKSLRFRRGEV